METIQKQTNNERHELFLEKTYIVSILIKLVFAIFETVSGLVLLLIPDRVIEQALVAINEVTVEGFHFNFHEASQDKLFAALYLTIHGIPKIILAIVLLKRKLWGYPLAIVILTLFIMYQLYEIVTTHSGFMVALTIFDLFVGWLIIHEWRRDHKRFKTDRHRNVEPSR